MKKTKYARLLIITLFAWLPQSQAEQNCSRYNLTIHQVPYSNRDFTEHLSGEYDWIDALVGSCIYVGSQLYSESNPCAVTANADSSYIATVSGELDTLVDKHVSTTDHRSGSSTSNGSQVIADTEAAVAFQPCLVLGCNVTIGFSGSGQGAGFNVTFDPPSPTWKDTRYYKQTCDARTLPPIATGCPSPTSPYLPQSTSNGYYTWDSTTCQWVWNQCGGGGPNCSGTPIVLDTSHHGFAFSDPTKGHFVTFDLSGNGINMKMSWPIPGSGNAWLVYDRDGDGVIKDGTELFGNFSPHSSWVPGMSKNEANGFVALGWYDQPAQGGNGDDIIDSDDAVWSKLRLWIDTHCYLNPNDPCKSKPWELHTPDSLGIHSISVIYEYDPNKIDEIGNWFKLYSYVNPDIASGPRGKDHRHLGPDGTRCCKYHQQSHDGRRAYDVYLRFVP
jgi:hypothetical protein